MQIKAKIYKKYSGTIIDCMLNNDDNFPASRLNKALRPWLKKAATPKTATGTIAFSIIGWKLVAKTIEKLTRKPEYKMYDNKASLLQIDIKTLE